MHLTSMSDLSRTPRGRKFGSIAEPDRGTARLWLRRRISELRRGWRAFETFLVDYYRACGVVASSATAVAVRCGHLHAGEVLTLEASHGWKTVEVVSGEMWLTLTPANNDLLLGPGARFELGESFPVVIEALVTTEIVLRG